MVALDLAGADAVDPVGAVASDTVVSYFRGQQDAWLTNVPAFEQVSYPNAWTGIDVRYERAPGNAAMKSTYVVAPNADPRQIHLVWRGVSDARLLEDGALEIVAPSGHLREEGAGGLAAVGGWRQGRRQRPI